MLAVAAVIGVAACVYFGVRACDLNFRDNAMGNLFATVLGLVAGIPAGLWISRKQQEGEVARQAEKTKEEAELRRRSVLGQVREELEFDHSLLEARLAERQAIPAKAFPSVLKNELWNAYSYSGDLQWIDDPLLLSIISHAYYRIAAVNALEIRLYDAVNIPGMRGDSRVPDTIAIDLLRVMRDSLAEVKDAIEAINGALASPSATATS